MVLKLKTTAINLDQCQCTFVADFKASLSKLSDKLQNILRKVYTGTKKKKKTHTQREFTAKGRLFSQGGQNQSEGQR